MPHVVVDPLTRIEGHLRIEAEVEGGQVRKAWSSSTMFRGIERIMQGRDPRDAWLFTQRICGVCTTVHGIASLRAVENAVGAVPPPNAILIRNLVMASQLVQDHVIHFYHLHALDWVDLLSALQADPAKTARLAQSISDWPKSSADYFAGVKQRLEAFVDRGQLGPFSNAYWGHPAYQLPPELNLLGVAHYLEALEFQREFIRIHAVLGGKNPHVQGFCVGGVATPIDPDQQSATINTHYLLFARQLVEDARRFVAQVYLPDVLAVAPHYLDWAGHGAGVGNFLVYGDYPDPESPDDLFLPSGVIRDQAFTDIESFDHARVTEHVAHSWYRYAGGDAQGLHPYDGETVADYTGPMPPYERLDVEGKYSWVKAPRYDGLPMEVGPLARMLVAYGRGHAGAKKLVDQTLSALGVGPEALFSTLGRTAARALETQLMVEKMGDWIDGLFENMARRDLRIADTSKWDPESWPKQAMGFGLHEAPRGSLGHWIQIEDQEIRHYQAVVPSTWNSGPRDAEGQPGPYEAALVGTPVADPEQPLEILRTVHSFDPCMACAVHVHDDTGEERAVVKVVP